MRKTLVLVLAVLMMAMVAAPAAASPDFTIKANGQAYDGYFTVIDGSTIVPISFIQQIVPVDSKVDGANITMAMNGDTLAMKLGSKQAVVNGQDKVMPLSPLTDREQIMVPLRFVLENLGAQVAWNASTYEITVTSPVLKQGLTAEQMLGKITQAMTIQGRYKMKADTNMQMQMTADGQTQNMEMSGQVVGSIQEKPLLAYVTTEMKVNNITGTVEVPPEAIKSEVVMNGDGVFMTVPGVEGWVKMDMEGLDLNKLMEQYGSQDPVKSILQMKEFGATMNYADDQVIGGKSYGVIHVEMGQEALGKYLNSVLDQTGLLKPGSGSDIEAGLEQVMKNFKADIRYDMVFDYETYLTEAMDMDMDMNMALDVPANAEAGTPAMAMQIKSSQKAHYQIYDYGVEFKVPDVSAAKPMAEVLATMPAAPAQ